MVKENKSNIIKITSSYRKYKKYNDQTAACEQSWENANVQSEVDLIVLVHIGQTFITTAQTKHNWQMINCVPPAPD